MKARLTTSISIIVLVCLILTGCATNNIPRLQQDLLQIMKATEGQHISRLIQRLGPATRTVSDGDGGTIHIYRVDPQSIPKIPPLEPNTATGTSTAEFTVGVLHGMLQAHREKQIRERQWLLTLKMMFYVRPNGIIYFTKISHYTLY